MSPQHQKRTDRIATGILSVTVLLGLVAFLPGGFIAGDTLKGYILITGSMLALIVWLVGRLAEGSFHIPRSRLLLALGVFVGVTLLSAVFSRVHYLSFFGEGFDQGACMSLFSLGIMSFLVSVLFDTRKRLLGFLGGYVLVYFAVAVFQIVHLAYPAVTSLGIFTNRASTMLGTWTDLAYVSGAMLVGFTLVVTFFKPSPALRALAFVGSILALFFLVLVGSTVAYVVVGIAAATVLAAAFFSGRVPEHRKLPLMASVVTVLMVLLVATGGVFGGMLGRALSASSPDVHPSLASTLVVARDSLAKHPVLGAGPNDFLSEWTAYHPASFNLSAYWDTPFTSGASFLLTVAFLCGILGLLAVLWLLFEFFREMSRTVFRFSPEQEGSRLLFSALVLALYFIMLLLVAAPSVGVTMSAFFFLGLFISALSVEKRVPVRVVSFSRDQRLGFVWLVCVALVLCVAAASITFATKRLVSTVYFEKGQNAETFGDSARADMRFAEAIAVTDLPEYERARTALAEQTLESLFAEGSQGPISDSGKTEIQDTINTGIVAAERAVTIDPASVQDYDSLGEYLSLLASLNIPNAETSAVSAYQESMTLAPNYPEPDFGLAEMYFATGGMKDALAYADKALALKSNYADAQALLVRIDLSTGDKAGAIAVLTELHAAYPDDIDVVNALEALSSPAAAQGANN